MTIVSSFLFALVLTIWLELIVAFFFGFRNRLEIAAIVCVNTLTNPLLNYLLLALGQSSFFQPGFLTVLLLELLVVVSEWKLLIFALQKDVVELFKLSFAMNLFSYMLGSYILGLFW